MADKGLGAVEGENVEWKNRKHQRSVFLFMFCICRQLNTWRVLKTQVSWWVQRGVVWKGEVFLIRSSGRNIDRKLCLKYVIVYNLQKKKEEKKKQNFIILSDRIIPKNFENLNLSMS